MQAPPESSRELFLLYAALEEKHGLSRSAMAVYEEAVRTVPLTERFPLYELYLARASDFFGVGKVAAPAAHQCLSPELIVPVPVHVPVHPLHMDQPSFL